MVTAEDAPGSKPDPVETRQSTVDFDEFIVALGDLAVDPDTEEMTDVFTEAGFEGAVIDTRFFGETHSPEAPHIVSSVIQLQSEEGRNECTRLARGRQDETVPEDLRRADQRVRRR